MAQNGEEAFFLSKKQPELLTSTPKSSIISTGKTFHLRYASGFTAEMVKPFAGWKIFLSCVGKTFHQKN